MRSIVFSIINIFFVSWASLSFAQPRLSVPNDVVWHWFAHCQRTDTLQLQVYLNGKSIYETFFPVCAMRRDDIPTENSRRILKFFLNAKSKIFGTDFKGLSSGHIEGNIWEAGCDSDQMLLGVSFVEAHHILLNSIHIAKPHTATRTNLAIGLIIKTYPLRMERIERLHKK